MRIGIDARFYGGGAAGLGRYTQELIRHLNQADTEHTYVAFVRPEDLEEFTANHPKIETRVTNIPWYSFREQLTLDRQLRAADLDLVHFTNFNFPLSYRQPFIISINDLTLLRFAGRSKLSRFKTRPMRLVMQQGARRSLKILTYSEFQKKLIVESFGVDPQKVVVAYLAVDEQFKTYPASAVEDFRKRMGLSEPFVMYTGQWRQHKNLVRLIKAFKQVHAKHKVKLVLVGKKDPAFPIIPQTIEQQGLSEHVILTDFVSDEDLPLYYNAADIFAFPSLSEGFGLPPLEAMASGTTVASSNAGPMPEILEDAAVYYDPYDTDDISRVLDKLLSDPALREKCREKGLQQVKKYSWERTAQATFDAYGQALEKLAR